MSRELPSFAIPAESRKWGEPRIKGNDFLAELNAQRFFAEVWGFIQKGDAKNPFIPTETFDPFLNQITNWMEVIAQSQAEGNVYPKGSRYRYFVRDEATQERVGDVEGIMYEALVGVAEETPLSILHALMYSDEKGLHLACFSESIEEWDGENFYHFKAGFLLRTPESGMLIPEKLVEELYQEVGENAASGLPADMTFGAYVAGVMQRLPRQSIESEVATTQQSVDFIVLRIRSVRACQEDTEGKS